MQTDITAEPTLTLPAAPPAELTYRLRVKDLAAYWVYLCCHARHLLPPAVRTRLRWPAPVLYFCLAAGALLTFALTDQAIPWPWYLKAVAALLLAALGSALIADLVFSHRPDRLFNNGRAGALHRWMALRALYGLAQEQADSRALDTAATCRFSMTAEGFTLLTEREETCAGIVTVAGKRIQGPWAALEHVGGTASHLFLTARDGTAFIVPCGAAHGLVETATSYHRAALESAPPATGIVLRVEQVQGASRPSQGILRPEDRLAQPLRGGSQ
jgi:hypothetical protein